MKITLITRDGKCTILEVDSNETVEELKSQIFKLKSIRNDQQLLIFDCIALKNGKSLSDYYIKEESIILLIEKANSLLLNSSSIFFNPSLIDNIRQSCIDLTNNPPKQEVINLLMEAISYLDDELDFDTKKEIFLLICECFSYIPEESYNIYQNKYKKQTHSSIHIILLIVSLAKLAISNSKMLDNSYNELISNTMNQVIPQIQESQELKIEDFEITPEFKTIFIANLVIISKLTEQIVTTFYPFFFTKEIDYITLNCFIQKVYSEGLLKLIPDSIFLENDTLSRLSLDNIIKIVSISSESTFKKLYKIIEEKYIVNRPNIDTNLSNSILNKIFEFSMRVNENSLSNLMYCFSDISSNKPWEYLSKFKIQIHHSILTEKPDFKIENYPKTPLVLKTIDRVESLPQEIISYYLLNANSLDIYDYAFESSDIECRTIGTIEFWEHVLSIVSISNDESISISRLIESFSFYFQKYIKPDEVFEIYDQLIFNHFPPNEKQSDFLYKLMLKLSKQHIFAFHQNDSKLNDKLLKQKRIPPPNLFKLFNLSGTLKPNNLYNVYIISFIESRIYLSNNIQISPSCCKSTEILIKFIKQKDNYDLLVDIDEGTLSLIAASLLFKKTKTSKIYGLTVENVLPFIALSTVDNSDIKISKLLIDACIFASKNPSPLSIASIDSIILEICNLITNDKHIENTNMMIMASHLSKKNSFANNKFIVNRFIITLLVELCDQFVKGEYKADQLNFILLAFKIYSLECPPQVFKTNNSKIFEIIIQNIPKIITDKRFKGILLDLNAFTKQQTAKIFSDIIDCSTSYEPIIQTMTFVISYCKNCPYIVSENISNINTALQKAIYENKWDDVSIIINYMKKNYFKINKEYFSGKKIPFDMIDLIYNVSQINDVNDMITVILSCPNLEKDTTLFNGLFNKLMKNSTIAIEYMTICLEKITTMQTIPIDQAFLYFQDMIEKYEYNLMLALDTFYSYSSDKKLLIRKINPYLFLNSQAIDYEFLVKLIENRSYQSFICLHNIASSFPFLFEPDNDEIQPLLAVEIVLPTLNCIPSIFDDDANDDKINDLKTMFAAISFLISCLHSVRFISIFVVWLFENITKLNEPQIFCFLHILQTLFNTEKINKIVLAYAIKYNFLDTLTKLLDRNIEKVTFKKYYDQIIFNLSKNYYNLFSSIKKLGDVSFIEQIKNGENKNPFIKQFNYFKTICPIQIRPFYLNLSNSTSNTITNFVHEINEIKPFWIHSTARKKKIIKQKYSHFQSLLLSKMKSILDLKNPTKLLHQKVPEKISIDAYRFLLSFPQWTVNFIENYYSLSPSYKIIEDIPEYNKYFAQISQNKSYSLSLLQLKVSTSTIVNNPYDHYKKEIYSQEFFKQIVKEAIQLNDLNDSQSLTDLINLMKQKNNQLLDFIIKYTSEYMNEPSISSQELAILCQILVKVWRKDKELDSEFQKSKFVTKLVNIALSGTFQQNELLLDSLCTFLQSLINGLPNQIIHVIGVIFAYHPNLIIKAIDLYLKIGDQKCMNIIPIIQMRYKKDVEDVDFHIMRTKYLIENLPSITTSCISVTSNLLSKLISIYKLRNNSKQDIFDMIIVLFNICAPNPNKYKPDESSQQSIQDDSSDDFLFKVPDHIKKTSPIFWENFYEKNRTFLNEMIQKDINAIHKLCFLYDYEELLSFKLRYLFFKDNLKSVNRYGNYVNIKVSRSRILLESFGYWLTKKPEDFLSGFRIHFTDEDGDDQGGLTREWMTYLLKELFDPKLNLFLKSDNQSYYLNPLVDLDCFKTECLKMAGGIIALSIVKNNFVNVRLSSCLLKQLLHKEISIEDVKDYDESLYNSFQSILNSEDVSKFDLFFSIDEMQNGKLTHVNLVENGDKIKVTNENKDEYVIKYIDHKLKNSVLEQTKAFCEGFHSIIKLKYIESFRPKELDLLICGNKTIDVEDMKKNVQYGGDYHSDHIVIKMFYDVISKWDQEKLSKLILFITGSPKIGINGFADFRYNGYPLTISNGGPKERLPVAHTCSNKLDLPNYDNEKDMNTKLLMAIEVHQFGIS